MDDILDRRNGSPVQEEIKKMDRSPSCIDSGVRSLRFKARYYFKGAEKLTVIKQQPSYMAACNTIPSDEDDCSAVSEMCLVVDAVERMVKLMHNDCNNPKYCLLQKLSEKQLKTFGIVLAESELEDDDYIHCDLCGVYYRASCRLHPLFIVSDREVREENKPRAEQTLPAFFEIKTSKIPKAGLGVFAKMDIPIGLVFGPYQGILLSDPKKADQNGYSWEIRISGKPSQYIDGSDPRYSNWMRYINSSRFENEQNLIAFQYNGSVYYRVFRPISEGIELLVWYGNKYGESLGVLSVTQRQKIPVEKNPYIFG